MSGGRAANAVAALTLTVIAAATLWESIRWPQAISFAGNPTVVPRVLAGAMVVAAALLLWSPVDATPKSKGMFRRVAVALLLLIFLGLTMPWIGLPAAGFVTLFSLQRLNEVALKTAAVVSALTIALIWGAFATLLNVPLPFGELWGTLGRGHT